MIEHGWDASPDVKYKWRNPSLHKFHVLYILFMQEHFKEQLCVDGSSPEGKHKTVLLGALQGKLILHSMLPFGLNE